MRQNSCSSGLSLLRIPGASKGATIIEFIILLPVFLFTVLFLVWFGVILNARTSLASAVVNAVRLAGTRGRGEAFGMFDTGANRFVGSIPAIDYAHGYVDPISGVFNPGAAPAVGSRGDHLMTQSNTVDRYNDMTSHVYPAFSNHFDMPYPAYSYAIVYALQAMKMSVGSSLQFPCDPRDPANGGGCLDCRPVNPITLTDAPMTDVKLIEQVIAIRCDYRPTNFILTPLLKAIAWMSGGAAGNAEGFQVLSYGARAENYSHCYMLQYDDPGDVPDMGPVDKECCNNKPCT